MRLPFRFLPLLLGFLSAAQAAPLIFPLGEVKPGLKGECWTVFSGTQPQAFQFEVMGVAKDFAGPGSDVIWCKMLTDPTGQMVVAAGMSGSPCYIQGRNMGALAYGWAFNKDPIFGVQPIESMLELLRFKNNERSPSRTSRAFPASPSKTQRESNPMAPLLKKWVGFKRPFLCASGEAVAQMIPLPLEVNGLHPLAAERILQGLEEAGFLPQMASGGGRRATPDASDLQPGSAVTGVIATGDLNMAVTGTLSWRNGDQVLAFGHPFLGVGAVEIPIGKAEIIGVVSSYMRSMKMSNKGEIVGTFTQDRISAVSGTLGRIPKLAPMTVQIRHPHATRTFQLKFCDNKFFTPMVYQTALLQFLANVIDRSEEATLRLKSEIQLEGLPPLRFEDVFAGERFGWIFEAVQLPSRQLMPLYSNDFEVPSIRSVSVEIEIRPVVEQASLEEITVEPLQANPGERLRVRAGFQPWRGKRFYREYEVKLPEEVKSGEVELILADAPRMDQIAGNSNNHAPTEGAASGSDPRTMNQLIAVLNDRHPSDRLYLVLQKKSEGLLVQNQRLTALPSSVRKLLVHDQSADHPATIPDAVLSKTPIDFGSLVQGSRSVKIKIK